MNVGILGLGEVGLAIKKLCKPKHQVYCRTQSRDQLSGRSIDILHICIPWSQNFNSIVSQTIKELKPVLTIINSTVLPGTTAAIYQKTKTKLAHSPIIGIHPHLVKSIRLFLKPLGAVNQSSFNLAQKHFKTLGVKVVKFRSPYETELAKLLSTTYYAWNIIYEKWVFDLCQKHHAHYFQVYDIWNKIYNQGYAQLRPNVIRPVLKHVSGPIGGHCLIPNVKILQSWLKDDYTRFILKQNR